MKRFITYLLLTLFAGGCIKNDIPLPVVVPRITAMDVEGATAVNIDSEKRKVTITLDETTDIRSVNIRSITFADEATSTSWDITGAQDLSKPIAITLTIYQDYVWTITAEQPIERYFTVNGQVGSSEIDVANHRVVTYVNGSTDLNNISVTSLKLGPKDITTYTPDPTQLHDFSDMVQVEASYHDISEVWNIHIEQTETVVEMVSVDPWTAVVWLKASGVADRTNGFRYRASGAAEWIDVSGEALTVDGGTFSACVEGLQPLTSYECCAYSGDDVTEITTFQTEAAMQMPNSGFETFSNAESSKYSSFYDPASAVAELQTKWWDCGNKGSTTVGSSYTITMPDTSDKQEGSYSVKMQSQYVIIKFAAGNIFVGEFDRVIGTSGGVVNFGRPFTLRPAQAILMAQVQKRPHRPLQRCSRQRPRQGGRHGPLSGIRGTGRLGLPYIRRHTRLPRAGQHQRPHHLLQARLGCRHRIRRIRERQGYRRLDQGRDTHRVPFDVAQAHAHHRIVRRKHVGRLLHRQHPEYPVG